MRLYITATGRYVGTQDDARKDGRGWRLEDVPTIKEQLIDYLNALQSSPEPLQEPTPIADAPTPQPRQVEPERPLNPDVGDDEDGHPRARAAFTSLQVLMVTNPRSKHVQDLCFHISKLGGTDLAWVAAEVFGRVA